MFVVEVGEGNQPLAIRKTGTASLDGVVGGNIHLGGLGKRISDTGAALLVYGPVSGQVWK